MHKFFAQISCTYDLQSNSDSSLVPLHRFGAPILCSSDVYMPLNSLLNSSLNLFPELFPKSLWILRNTSGSAWIRLNPPESFSLFVALSSNVTQRSRTLSYEWIFIDLIIRLMRTALFHPLRSFALFSSAYHDAHRNSSEHLNQTPHLNSSGSCTSKRKIRYP